MSAQARCQNRQGGQAGPPRPSTPLVPDAFGKLAVCGPNAGPRRRPRDCRTSRLGRRRDQTERDANRRSNRPWVIRSVLRDVSGWWPRWPAPSRTARGHRRDHRQQRGVVVARAGDRGPGRRVARREGLVRRLVHQVNQVTHGVSSPVGRMAAAGRQDATGVPCHDRGSVAWHPRSRLAPVSGGDGCVFGPITPWPLDGWMDGWVGGVPDRGKDAAHASGLPRMPIIAASAAGWTPGLRARRPPAPHVSPSPDQPVPTGRGRSIESVRPFRGVFPTQWPVDDPDRGRATSSPARGS